MLYAELHGKLDDSASNHERIEDILTSTVFGTLFLADTGVQVLCEWLGCARRMASDGRIAEEIPAIPADSAMQHWFWPSLAEAEPDLLIRLGHKLFVIEVKYQSAMGQGDEDGVAAVGHVEVPTKFGNQLARQWRSCSVDSPRFDRYAPDLQAAIAECELTLVYLVSSQHYRRATRELHGSWAEIGPSAGKAASLCLLTWQDLHRVLVLRHRRLGGVTPRWVPDLAALLADRRKLAAFIGFPQSMGQQLGGAAAQVSAWGTRWNTPRAELPFQALTKLDLSAVHELAQAMSAYAVARKPRAPRALDGLDCRAIHAVAAGDWPLTKSATRERWLAGLDLAAIRLVAGNWQSVIGGTDD